MCYNKTVEDLSTRGLLHSFFIDIVKDYDVISKNIKSHILKKHI